MSTLKNIMRFVGSILSFILSLALAIAGTIGIYAAVWFFYGNTQIVATIDGKPLKGAIVEVNGTYVGETPLNVHLMPGVHDVSVIPGDVDTIEAEYTGTGFTTGIGYKIEVSFTSI